MHKITPFLWFDDNIGEAINLYTSAFKNSRVVSEHRSGDTLPGAKGKIFTATIELNGQTMYTLNGGPRFRFTPAISFFVNCETEAEIDELWKKLGDGGQVMMALDKYPFSQKFGWLQDKFGLSWQLNLTGSPMKITSFMMFAGDQQGKAEEAIKFYSSVFKNAETQALVHFGAGQGGEEGTVMHASFSLDGNEFKAMDGGRQHQFTFTPAFSFFVSCKTQDEVDYFWNGLAEGGRKDMCGWLADRYGVSWQIIPDTLGELLYDKDPVRSKRVVDAMMKMNKIDIQALMNAYENAG